MSHVFYTESLQCYLKFDHFLVVFKQNMRSKGLPYQLCTSKQCALNLNNKAKLGEAKFVDSIRAVLPSGRKCLSRNSRLHISSRV